MAKYLDRDDVLNVINYIRTKYISVYNRRNKCSQFWADTIRYFEKRINNLDGYDVEPVKHGHWIRQGSIVPYYECSECHCSIDQEPHYNYSDNIMRFPKYCEHCGAKMRAP